MTAVKTIARETRQEKGNAATKMGAYCGDSGCKADSDSGGESEGSAARTAGYHDNGGSSDEDDSKGNSGKNREQGCNNGGSVSHLSFFFWLGLGHGHEVFFF